MLFDAKHFTVSVIYSSAYIPLTVHLLSGTSFILVTFAIAAVISALSPIQHVHPLAVPLFSHISQKKRKFKVIRSGERGGQAIGPPLPIRQPGNFMFKHLRQCEQNEEVYCPVEE
jgi:hypothetical protein